MPRQNSTSWASGEAVAAARLNDFNEDIDDLYATGSDHLKVYHLAAQPALQVTIGPGTYRVGGTEGQYAGGTLTVGTSVTTYIMIDSAGAIQTSTSAWNSLYTRLAVVVSGASTITSITDWRNKVVGGILGGLVFDDTRAVATTPNDYNDLSFKAQFKNLSDIGLSGVATGTYARLIGFRGQNSSTFGLSHETAYCDDGIYQRVGSTTTWGVWKKISSFSNDIYGNGSDGNITISTNTTLTRDMQYNDLTINSGVTLTTDGYTVSVKGTLTNNGKIADNGAHASGATPGAGGHFRNDGSSLPTYTQDYIAKGGNGGAGGAYTSSPVYTVAPGVYNGWKFIINDPFSIGRILGTRFISGGGVNGRNSGFGGYNPGAGGASGGLVLVFCQILTGSGAFEAKGGNGSGAYPIDGYGGGGGGGGGGGLAIVITSSSSFTGTNNVSGGIAGASSGAAATAGESGIYKLLII